MADFFPEYLPENPPRFMMEATVRHFLCMSSFNENPTYEGQAQLLQFIKKIQYGLRRDAQRLGRSTSFNENPTYDFETPDFVQSVFSLPSPPYIPGSPAAPLSGTAAQ